MNLQVTSHHPIAFSIWIVSLRDSCRSQTCRSQFPIWRWCRPTARHVMLARVQTRLPSAPLERRALEPIAWCSQPNFCVGKLLSFSEAHPRDRRLTLEDHDRTINYTTTSSSYSDAEGPPALDKGWSGRRRGSGGSEMVVPYTFNLGISYYFRECHLR